jgi:hypothetical protein
MVGPMWGVHLGLPIPGKVIAVGFMVGLLVLGVVIGAYLWWRSRRQYLVTSAVRGSPSMVAAVVFIHLRTRSWAYG